MMVSRFVLLTKYY